MMLWVKAFFITAMICSLILAFAVLQIILFPVLICLALMLFVWFILKMIQEDKAAEATEHNS